MANPTTRENLHFFPEDSKPSLSQAWQASRWLDELDSDLTTPMIRVHNQDFYINEPTILSMVQTGGQDIGSSLENAPNIWSAGSQNYPW